jgi:hypothetical protein
MRTIEEIAAEIGKTKEAIKLIRTDSDPKWIAEKSTLRKRLNELHSERKAWIKKGNGHSTGS